MKKGYKIILLIAIFYHSGKFKSYSQYVKEPSESTGACVKRYDVIVDGYYGFPYLVGSLVKQILADTFGITGARNLNHIGIRGEYLVWEHISFGGEFTYASLTLNYKGSSGKVYTARVDKKRLLAKFNYHFATSQKLDPYLTGGLGYSNTKVWSNEPGSTSEQVTVIPVALRVGIGIRYFFSDMFGINAEVGLGGPLMQAGVTLKF